MCLGV
jgi:hypothetical protein